MDDLKQISSSLNCCRVLNRVKRAVMEIELDGPLPPPREEKGPRQRNGRAVSRKMKRQRLVNKNGKIHVRYKNVPGRGQLYYLADHFTTLIEAQWRYVFVVFSLSFVVSWLVFGSIWWGIYSYRIRHGIQCIEKVSSWTSAFLFSLETQTTIGYGGRQITPNCPEGVVFLIIQCIIGLLISSTMLGLIFAKVSRPHKRTSTVMFSRHAVVGPRNGKLFLMFRVADLRRRQLIESHIRVFLVRRHVTKEGERIDCYRQPLEVGYDEDDEGEKIFLFTPAIVHHEINENSPFFEYSPDDLLVAEFEIVVILEGIVESTGMTTQARTSYLSDEIHWGHLFKDVMSGVSNGRYNIDISLLHETYAIKNFQRISAQEFYEQNRDRESGQENSQRQEMDEQIDRDLADVPQQFVRSGVTLIPNGEVDKDAVTKL